MAIEDDAERLIRRLRFEGVPRAEDVPLIVDVLSYARDCAPKIVEGARLADQVHEALELAAQGKKSEALALLGHSRRPGRPQRDGQLLLRRCHDLTTSSPPILTAKDLGELSPPRAWFEEIRAGHRPWEVRVLSVERSSAPVSPAEAIHQLAESEGVGAAHVHQLLCDAKKETTSEVLGALRLPSKESVLQWQPEDPPAM